MAILQQWLRHPQRVWLRRALFQIHLWTGVGVGLYVVAICLSGSALVFRAEIVKYLTRGPRTVAVGDQRLSNEEIGRAAQQDYPKYRVDDVWAAKQADQAVEVWLSVPGTSTELRREFDPYTGMDLGRRQPLALDVLSWVVVFHGNLGMGPAGHVANGVGGFLLVVLCITGLVIWWPGMGSWRRSLWVSLRSDWKRINWELHSVMGFWILLGVFMFGITGAYLVFTLPMEKAINVVAPLRVYRIDIMDIADDDASTASAAPQPLVRVFTIPADGAVRTRGGPPNYTIGDEMVRWATRLHYGRFAGWKVKATWVVLGLIPPLLFLTGALMWWNRVLRPSAWRARKRARLAASSAAPGAIVELQEIGSTMGSSTPK